MNVYLVRICDDRELVGIFAAESLAELYIIIDETCCDPADCEYMPLPTGGIGWPEPQAPVVPAAEDDDSDDYYFRGASFSMRWGLALHGDDYQPVPLPVERTVSNDH